MDLKGFKISVASAIIILLAGCGVPSGRLTIAVSANMQYAMKDIAKAYEEETGVAPELIISSSGKLTAQIKEGAPYHLFVSADTKYPEDLYQKGFTAEAPKDYAEGTLILWTARDNYDISLDALTSGEIKHIAMANPNTAPYGRATEEALRKYGIYDSVKPKIVLGESISQVNNFVVSQSVEAGFTAMSVVKSDEMRDKGRWIAIPDSLHSPIRQALVKTKYGQGNPEAEKFYNFMFSDKVKAILTNYGYRIN